MVHWLRDVSAHVAAIIVAGVAIAAYELFTSEAQPRDLGKLFTTPLTVPMWLVIVTLAPLVWVAIWVVIVNIGFVRTAGRAGPRGMIVKTEAEIYKRGVRFLESIPQGAMISVIAYAPGAFAERQEPGQLGPKAGWVKALAQGLIERRIGRLSWVIGLPSDARFMDPLMDFLEREFVDRVQAAIKTDRLENDQSVSIHYVSQPARTSPAAGIGFTVLGDQAFFLGCAMERDHKDGPSRLDRAWLWADREMAKAFAQWFHNYGEVNTEPLWAPGTSFEQGRTNARRQFTGS